MKNWNEMRPKKIIMCNSLKMPSVRKMNTTKQEEAPLNGSELLWYRNYTGCNFHDCRQWDQSTSSANSHQEDIITWSHAWSAWLAKYLTSTSGSSLSSIRQGLIVWSTTYMRKKEKSELSNITEVIPLKLGQCQDITHRLVNYWNECLKHLCHIKFDIWNPVKYKVKWSISRLHRRGICKARLKSGSQTKQQLYLSASTQSNGSLILKAVSTTPSMKRLPTLEWAECGHQLITIATDYAHKIN